MINFPRHSGSNHSIAAATAGGGSCRMTSPASLASRFAHGIDPIDGRAAAQGRYSTHMPELPLGQLCTPLPGRCQHAARLFSLPQRCRLNSDAPQAWATTPAGLGIRAFLWGGFSHRRGGDRLPPNAGTLTSHQDGEIVARTPTHVANFAWSSGGGRNSKKMPGRTRGDPEEAPSEEKHE